MYSIENKMLYIYIYIYTVDVICVTCLKRKQFLRNANARDARDNIYFRSINLVAPSHIMTHLEAIIGNSGCWRTWKIISLLITKVLSQFTFRIIILASFANRERNTLIWSTSQLCQLTQVISSCLFCFNELSYRWCRTSAMTAARQLSRSLADRWNYFKNDASKPIFSTCMWGAEVPSFAKCSTSMDRTSWKKLAKSSGQVRTLVATHTQTHLVLDINSLFSIRSCIVRFAIPMQFSWQVGFAYREFQSEVIV